MRTGWTDEPPEAEAPAMPLTERLLAMRQRGPGDTLALALARSCDRPDPVPDPDERAANMIAAGLMPGQVSDLAQRYADAVTAAQDERDKLEKSARRQERIARDHAAGRITAFDIANMPDPDGGEGDEATAERLERRAESLRRQLAESAELMAPQRAPEDPLQAASRRAHQVFTEVTRQRMAEAQARRAAPRERRPFGSASPGGAAVRSEPVTCPECIKCGFTAEQSFVVHHTDADGRPIAAASEVAEPASDSQEAGRYQPVRAGGRDWVYDKAHDEIVR